MSIFLILSLCEPQMPVFTGFFRFDVANTLQTRDTSLGLITPQISVIIDS